MHPKIIDDDKLIELYNQGLNDHEIAKVFNVTRASVQHRRKDFGLKSKYGEMQKEMIAQRNQKIKELHSKGLNNREITEELHIDRTTVSDVIKAFGLKSNAKRGIKRISKNTVKALYGQGLNDREIASNLGCSSAAVCKIRHMLRLKSNEKRGGGRSKAQHERAMKLQENIKRLLGDGLTDREIAEKLNYSKGHIRKTRIFLNLPSNIKFEKQHLKNRKFTNEQLKDDVRNGLTDREIADKYNCSQVAVYLRRKKLGLKINNANLTSDKLKEAYYSGKFKSEKEIAEYLNSSAVTIRKLRHELGLESLGKKYSREVNRRILDMCNKGYRTKDIAKEIGVTSEAISKRKKTLGSNK